MENKESGLSKSDISALRSRWNDQDPKTGETLLALMIHKLKTECGKHNPDRPVHLDLRGMSLFHEDLSGLDLSGYDFSYANLNRSNFSGTIFGYSKFHMTSLEHAVLDECEFIGSDLTHAVLNECSAKRGGFGGADLSYARIIHADFSDATLSQSKLLHTDFRASVLKNARLTEADLSFAVFTRAILAESDLKYSNVNRTSFELADLQGCRLLGIRNYKKAGWVGADIRGMDLRGAYLVRRYIADENYLYEFRMTSKFHRVLYFLWWISSDCGRSLSRWFVWLLSITLMFSCIYTQVDIDYGVHPTAFSPIYFSFVTLTTLGYGDAIPASLPAQVFVTFQAVTGYIGLGGLLSIFGNKMARRAE